MDFSREFAGEKLKRYARQIILPKVGEEGQRKLEKSSVLLVGVGGLGSAVAYYLAAAGIGEIGLVDSDQVEVTNLNRQILHNPLRIGENKAVSAKKTLEIFNPEIKVSAFQERFTSDIAAELIPKYDCIVDCTDNLPSRYLLNEVALEFKKPFFYGAVSEFEGQTMTILPDRGPCYRCLYPSAPSLPLPRGVLGVVPGLVGLIQVSEVIKYLLGVGELLVGELLIINVLKVEFFKLQIKRNERCAACGRMGKR